MSDEEERDRDALARLAARLKRARESSRILPRPPAPDRAPATGLGLALRIGVEMVAGVGVGAGLGYLLDQWFGTSPWLLILFFFLGAGAGGLNTWRAIIGSGFGPVPGRDKDDKRGDSEG